MRSRAALIRVSLMLALIVPAWTPGPADPAAADKIAPWVMAHTLSGGTAEFLVVLAEQADLSGAALLAGKSAKGEHVAGRLRATAQTAQGPLLAWLAANGIEHRAFYIVNAVWVRGDRSVALALAARPEVARVEGNPALRSVPEPIPAPHLPTDPAAPSAIETGISYVHAPEVWALGHTGQGIVVGGQDTGYQWDHPALKPHYRGWDGSAADHDYNWHDAIHVSNPACPADSPAPCDDHGHGTHTIGTAVGDDGAGNQIGVAPGAEWIGCRNMNQGAGTPASYLECFEFFLAPYPVGGTPADGDPEMAPDVTVNSWSCPASEGCAASTLQAAVEAQRAAGIMTVVAATNSGPACSTVADPPAIYEAAYTIGALNTGTDLIASFSSRGPVTSDGSSRPKPDLAAPGTMTRSSYPANVYVMLSGTSMATPHVAGAAALLWSAHPALKNQIDLTEQILNDSAVHINSSDCSGGGSWPNTVYGYGRLDAKAAVESIPMGSGVLRGAVSNGFTSAPISGASITASYAVSPTLAFTVVSDSLGQYETLLFPGDFNLTVTAFGYLPTTMNAVTISDGVTETLDIAMLPAYNYFFPMALHEVTQ